MKIDKYSAILGKIIGLVPGCHLMENSA